MYLWCWIKIKDFAVKHHWVITLALSASCTASVFTVQNWHFVHRTNWQEPCIVFSAHWRLWLVPVVNLLRRWCGDPNSLLVLEVEHILWMFSLTCMCVYLVTFHWNVSIWYDWGSFVKKAYVNVQSAEQTGRWADALAFQANGNEGSSMLLSVLNKVSFDFLSHSKRRIHANSLHKEL